MISTTIRKAGPYAGDGSTKSFPFSFKVFRPQDVAVYALSAAGVETQPSGYTVSLNSNQNVSPGGSVVFAAAPANGSKITLTSAVAELQPMQITNSGGFFPAVLNDSADRQTILIQQLSEKLRRAVTTSISDASEGMSLPAQAQRTPGALVGWGDSGQFITRSMIDVALAITSALTPILPTTAFDLVGQWLTPEMFGAKGDGVSDDTPAFDVLNAAILAKNGACVRFRAGAVYLGGRQQENTAGLRFNGPPLLKGNNLRFFILDMNGATLKSKPGYFGAFKADGSVSYDVTPGVGYNVYANQRADLPSLIQCFQTDMVEIRNGFLDGNGATHTVGGPWADTGRQCGHYGLYVFNCNKVVLVNVHANNFLLDGFGLGYTGQFSTTVVTPMTVTNCTSKNAGRNCVSLVGGLRPVFTGCVWEDAGSCDNPSVPGATAGSPTLNYVNSSPASCFDVEAEGTEIRDPVFIACDFIAGTRSNTCFVTDSGDSSGHYFSKCTFSGNLWLNKPSIVVEDCKIYGTISKLYGQGRDDKTATKLIGCQFGDNVGFNRPVQPIVSGDLFIDGSGNLGGVVVKDCVGYFTRKRLNFRGMIVTDCTFTLAWGLEVADNRDYGVLADAAIFDNVTFIDNLGSATGQTYPANEGVFITLPDVARNGTRIIPSSARYNLKWGSWSAGAGAYPHSGQPDGEFVKGVTTHQRMRFGKEFSAGGFYGWAGFGFASFAFLPANAVDGSFTHNGTPVVGGPGGWSSLAGVWQPVGIVGAVQAASVPAAAGATPTKAEFDALIVSLQNAKLMKV